MPARPFVARIVLPGLVGLLLGVAPGWAYQEAPVTGGGTLKGRVLLLGTPPPSRIFHMVFSPNITYCSRVSDGNGNRLLKEFRVSDQGGLQDVVVAVVGVDRGKPFDYTPEINLENCRIGPMVMPVRNRHPIAIVNKDPVVHDIQAYTIKDPYTFAMFNKPMVPMSAASKEVVFRKQHYLFKTQCGVHDFMQSWGMAVGNPYFDVTGPNGEFTITDLPPGTYDVIAWHPQMAVRSQEVTIEANGEAELRFEFDAAEVDIPLHDLQTGYRLQPALDAIALTTPIVELQEP